MGPRQSTANADRFETLASWTGLTLGLLHLATAFRDWPNLVPGLLDRTVAALAFVAGGLAIGWVGSYLGNLLWRVNDLSRQLSATAADRNAEMRQILDQLETLVAASKPAATESPYRSDPSDDLAEDVADPLPTPTPCGPAAAASALAAPGVNERVVELLEEIREVALMDDEQRHARLQQHLDARRRAGLDQVFGCVRGGQWAAADQALCSLEVQFAADASVKQARVEFQRQRDAAEPDTLFHTEQRVRDLVQVGSFDRAIAGATEFVNNFPASADGRRLLTEVYREHEAYRDSAFQRLYEQVQANVDRRQWRAALADAQRLLEQFPTHSRANRIRRELKTIATNAEIEERQEQELRIQLLVRNRRFAEAVELAEEVVRRFPESPQADALEERLPQLRELAEHGGGNGI
jgi:tetratricopeptide (TPR) repeat protein